ncbi:MAG: DMT family transporter [Hyphomicrobiaceae bacterium]|nr:DMT family transporter [Hyphomicrobiaceae bacterium]
MTPSAPRSAELKAAVVAAVGAISVGFVPMFVTGLQKAGMSTPSTLLWRYIVALAILVPLALWFHRLVDEWHRGGKWLVLNGLTLGVTQVFCYFKAIETLPTSVVVTLFYFYPVLALLLDRILFRLPIHRATLVGVTTIILGVALTSSPGFSGATIDPQGLVFVALSALGYALYIAAAYPVTKSVAPLASAVFIYGSYATAFGLTALVRGFALPPSPELWLNVLFIGTLGGALQILSFSYALPRLASSGYAVIVCLEVVTVVVAGVLLLGERLSALQWLGIALVLGGILLERVARSARQARVAPATASPGRGESQP